MKINKTVSNNPKNKIFIGRGRGGKHAKEKKSRGRPRLLSDQDISSKWTLQEKTKLLKGLKIYEANDLKALSEMVASKTPDEVEELIQAMRTAETKRCHYQLPADSNAMKKNPLEIWLALMNEMVYFENKDLSTFLPEILGIITKNEQFEESQHKKLHWDNIYQYLTYLAKGDNPPKRLSNIEALVLLDIMQNLGDTFKELDTTEQRRVLNIKHELLSFHTVELPRTQREIGTFRVALALSNKFDNCEEDLDATCDNDPASSGSQAAQSTCDLTAGPSHAPDLCQPSTSDLCHPSTSDLCQPSTSDLCQPSTSDLCHPSTPDLCQPSTPDLCQPSTSDLCHPSTPDLRQPSTSDPSASQANLASCSAGVLKFTFPIKGCKKLIKPKFFSLNPLCISSKLMQIEKKKKAEGETS